MKKAQKKRKRKNLEEKTEKPAVSEKKKISRARGPCGPRVRAGKTPARVTKTVWYHTSMMHCVVLIRYPLLFSLISRPHQYTTQASQKEKLQQRAGWWGRKELARRRARSFSSSSPRREAILGGDILGSSPPLFFSILFTSSFDRVALCREAPRASPHLLFFSFLFTGRPR